MRSGNGRHRRPRQAPSIVVAAGVTSAGIALPLLGAAGAHAADVTTWDRVAECESGGLWSANNGNGFYGGLQLTLDMWKDNGGDSYAPRPDLASRSQQITVAESILDASGPEAWPSCALNAGLKGGGTAPDVNPGSTQTPDPDDSGDPGSDDGGKAADKKTDGKTGDKADKADKADKKKADGKADDKPGDGDKASDKADEDGKDSKDGKGDKADKGSDGEAGHEGGSGASADPTRKPGDDPSAPADGGSGSTEGGSGRHRGPADPSDGTRSGGRHASRGDADRTDDPADSTGGKSDKSDAGHYVVRPGDNLSVIAQRHDLANGWTGLYEANERVVGSDPDLILPGQKLDLESAAQ